jgi:hypothetical protein
MLFWFPVVMLGIDALHVVEMRLRMIASGKSTPDEMFLMVIEKIGAMEEAVASLLARQISTATSRGGSAIGKPSKAFWP